MKLHRLFFLATIFFLPTQLGLHFWPEWSLVLGRQIDYLSPTLFVSDILLFLMLGSWCMSQDTRIKNQVTGLRLQTSNFKLQTTMWSWISPYAKYLLPLFILILIAFMNISVAWRFQVAILAWAKVIELMLFFWYIRKTKPAFSWIVGAITIGMVGQSLLAIFQFLLQHSVSPLFWYVGERFFTSENPGIARTLLCLPVCREVVRGYGTFPHPNVLGGYISIALLFFSFLVIHRAKIFKGRIRMPTWLIVVTGGIGIFGLVVSFSRSASVSLLVAAVLFFLKRQKNGINGLIVALGILGVCFFFWLRPVSLQDESLEVRSALNQASLAMIASYPIQGVGLGNFLVALPTVLSARSLFYLQPVHAIYLLLVSELGFVGSLGVIGVCLYVVWKCSPHAGYPPDVRFLARVGLLMMALVGFVDHYSVTLQQGRLLLTLLLALAF